MAITYGIIGLGQVSSKGHIPSLLRMPDAEIVAIADVDDNALREAARRIGSVRAYRDPAELLKDPRVEVVLVATPNWLHREQTVAALAAGKHVFCEKPLGIDEDEGRDILAAQKESGKLLQVGHELRYSTLLSAAKQRIDEGLIGNLQMMVIQEFRFPLLPGWRQTGRTGGIMLEKNSHFFDLFNWFAGTRPLRVVGVGGNSVNKDSPLVDHCTVTVEYEKGLRATLLMCLFAEHGSQLTMDLVGDRGRLIVYGGDRALVHNSRRSDTVRRWEFKEGAGDAWHVGFQEEHEAFARSIRHGAEVLVDGREAFQALRVSLAAERAVNGETVVMLEDTE